MSASLTDEVTPGLAVFDLDYTLTKRGTWGRFVWSWVKFRPHIWLPLLLSAGWTQWKYKRGLCPRVDVKRKMMCWAMAGASRDKLFSKGQLFAQREFANGLRPGALEAVKMHRDQGDILVMISAAVDVIAEPIGELLKFDYVISTEMGFDDCNILKSNFNTPNCYGGQKVDCFNSLIDENPVLKQYITNITFYSDSYSDLAMFRLANVCVAIHPDRKLSQHASEEGWRISHW
ncbi:MAG: HAD family hydrolase [Maricaulaceae bacterium]